MKSTNMIISVLYILLGKLIVQIDVYYCVTFATTIVYH